VVIPFSYAALREAMWERERERKRDAARGVAGAPGGGRRRLWRRAHGCVVSLLLQRPLLYIVGRGCTLPLHQGSPRAAAKGRSDTSPTYL
jgi:hypothetical protein